jgi:hypothetical protein
MGVVLRVAIVLACWMLASACQLGAPAHRDARATEAEEFSAQVLIDEWFADVGRGYELLTPGYKARLKDLGVSNADDYVATVRDEELIWKHRYQKPEWLAPSMMRVSVLVNWEQEGSEGVQTLVFDLVREGSRWRIANID